jgi:hypothetical protein
MKKLYYIGLIIVILAGLFVALRTKAQVNRTVKRIDVSSTRFYYADNQYFMKVVDGETSCYVFHQSISCVK